MILAYLKRVPRLFKKLGKPYILIPVLAVLLIVGLAVLGFYLLGDWLVAVVAVLAIALTVMVYLLLRTSFEQEREERLERGIGDRPVAMDRTGAQRSASEGVEDTFLRALREIKDSRLGAGGVYSLPWILVLGEAGSGKSAALRASGLQLPAQFANSVGTGATQSCDFWLANEAIVLDTAGRWLESDDESTAGEWRSALALLKRHRPGGPLDGLVVTVPITSLFGKSRAELKDDAQRLRRRINELEEATGIDVPIYILVTKADLIEGFVETANAIPQARWGEALGWTNDRREAADAEELVLGGLSEVRDRLESVLPELILRDPDPARRRRIFLFPQEFDDASRAVAAFIAEAFRPAAYDEVPFLRGVYFCSARREGSTLSPLLHRLGHDWARSAVDGACADGGLFLKDVFHDVIVGDRNLALPVGRRSPRARRLVHLAAGLGVLALAVWWSVVFAGDFRAIQRLSGDAQPLVAGVAPLQTIDRLRKTIVEEGIHRSAVRQGGLGGNLDRALARAKQTFVAEFGGEFEEPAKKQLKDAVRGTRDGAFEALATLSQDVAWMKERAPEEGLAAPDLTPFADVAKTTNEPAAFAAAYDAFLRWAPRDEIQVRINSEQDLIQAAVGDLLDLQRLERWMDKREADYPPARYADVGLPGREKSMVSGTYTARGWDGLVSPLLSAIKITGGSSGTQVTQFERGYATRFDRQWRSYFMGTPMLASARTQITRSPYLELVDQVHDNTRSEISRAGEPPVWIQNLQSARAETQDAVEGEADGGAPGPWQRYTDALAQVEIEVGDGVADGERALELARRASSGSSAFGQALRVTRDIVPTRGSPSESEKLREILAIPILDGASAVFGRALEELDDRWKDRIVDVYGHANLTDTEMAALYARGRDLDEFRDEELDPFYEDGEARDLLSGRRLALGPGFIAWLEEAKDLQRALYGGGGGGAPEIAVRLQGVPADIVRGKSPGMRVTRQELRLTCANSKQTFTYRQGTGNKTYKWSPDCSELRLRVWALDRDHAERELQPAQTWRGPLALPNFLEEAQPLAGNRYQWAFRFDDPEAEIEITYELRAGRGILDIKHAPPPLSVRN